MFLYHILEAYAEVPPGHLFEGDGTIFIAKCNKVICRPGTTFPVILYWDILKLFFMELCFLQCIRLGLCVCAHVHKHACAHIHVRLYTCALYGVNEEAIRRITLEPIRVSQAFLRRTLHWYLLLFHEITTKQYVKMSC